MSVMLNRIKMQPGLTMFTTLLGKLPSEVYSVVDSHLDSVIFENTENIFVYGHVPLCRVFKAEVKMVEHTENGVIEIVDVNIWDGEVNLSEQLVQGGYARIMEDHADATPERSSGERAAVITFVKIELFFCGACFVNGPSV